MPRELLKILYQGDPLLVGNREFLNVQPAGELMTRTLLRLIPGPILPSHQSQIAGGAAVWTR